MGAAAARFVHVLAHPIEPLFVVRVAGNVCAPSTIGSIEYAASALGDLEVAAA